MAPSYMILLAWSLVLKPALGLQVTPNSGCASLCMDDPTADASDPYSSNTYTSDIVCTDTAYRNTTAGQKFESCVSCLQSSTANTTTENDQEWFLYNVRFAFNTCLFTSPNAPVNASANASVVASQPFSSSCSASSVCGPLAMALAAGTQEPSIATRYEYCGTDNTTFGGGGSSFDTCLSCLRENPDQLYLANQLIALEAGCIQQPKPGTLLSLNGTIFSDAKLNITTPIVAATTTKHKSIAPAVIAGTVIGVVALLGILSGLFILFYRCRAARLHKRVRSSLDARYGHTDITSPVSGAYNVYSQPSPSPVAYETVGLIKVPAPTKTARIHDKLIIREHNGPDQNKPDRANSKKTRTFGFKKLGKSNDNNPATEQPQMTHSPTVQYYSDGSSHISQSTPSGFAFMPTHPAIIDTSNIIRSTTITSTAQLSPSAVSVNVSPFSTKTATTSFFSTARSPPITPGSGTRLLPSPGAGLPGRPKRSPSITAANPYTVATTPASATSGRSSVVRNFSRLQNHARDLSVQHGGGASGGISGPIVSVQTRYEEEEEEDKRRRLERERVYREAVAKTLNDGPKKKSVADVEDLW